MKEGVLRMPVIKLLQAVAGVLFFGVLLFLIVQFLGAALDIGNWIWLVVGIIGVFAILTEVKRRQNNKEGL